MSSIQKITNLKGISYRVFIRRKGIQTITKTFPSKKLASQFVLKLEGNLRMLATVECLGYRFLALPRTLDSGWV